MWGRLGGPGRALTVGLLLAIAAAAFLSARTGQPTYVALPGQPFDPKETAAVLDQLGELKVAYRQGPDGQTIVVPQQQMLTARLALAQAGVPRGFAGLELFDTPRLGATDFDRRVLLLRALQGELSQAIAAMAPIQSATVKLAIPEQSVFVREQRPVKAAVLLQPRRQSELSAGEVEGIVRFLAWSVPELDPENVMVVDHSGRVLAAGLRGEDGGGPRASDQMQAQLTFQRELEQRLQGMLERTLGPGNVAVAVSVTLEFERTRQERLIYEPGGPGGQPVKRSEQASREFSEGGGQPAGQAAGVDANTLNPPSYQATAGSSGASTYERSQNVTNWELNEVRTVVESAPGRVSSVSVGVFVNAESLPAGSATAMAQIQEVVAKAVGTPVANVTVATLPFRNSLVEALQAPQPSPPPPRPWAVYGVAAAAAMLLVLLLAWLWLRRRTPTPMAGMSLPTALPGAAALAEAAAGEEEAAARAERTQREWAERMELLGEDLVQRLGLDPQRKRLKSEVEKLAQEHPELAASLVQAWLRDDR